MEIQCFQDNSPRIVVTNDKGGFISALKEKTKPKKQNNNKNKVRFLLCLDEDSAS